MKAQLALIEVFLATFTLAAAATSIAALAYTPSLAAASRQISIGNAAYDFVALAYGNTSVENCMANLTGECGGRIASEISAVYNLKGVELSSTGKTVSSGATTGCGAAKQECLPLRQNQGFAMACIYLCSD